MMMPGTPTPLFLALTVSTILLPGGPDGEPSETIVNVRRAGYE